MNGKENFWHVGDLARRKNNLENRISIKRLVNTFNSGFYHGIRSLIDELVSIGIGQARISNSAVWRLWDNEGTMLLELKLNSNSKRKPKEKRKKTNGYGLTKQKPLRCAAAITLGLMHTGVRIKVSSKVGLGYTFKHDQEHLSIKHPDAPLLGEIKEYYGYYKGKSTLYQMNGDTDFLAPLKPVLEDEILEDLPVLEHEEKIMDTPLSEEELNLCIDMFGITKEHVLTPENWKVLNKLRNEFSGMPNDMLLFVDSQEDGMLFDEHDTYAITESSIIEIVDDKLTDWRLIEVEYVDPSEILAEAI